MKTRILVFLSLLLLVVSVAFVQQQSKKKQPAKTTIHSTGPYGQEWAKVDSLSKKGLSKSALEAVMNIYQKAKAEKNAPQLVKAVIHRMKFQSYTEEDAMKKIIADLKKESSEAPFPARPSAFRCLDRDR